ncbi:hypothetical protein B9Z19DRAFT_444650 [Tuber borchii]|uniref:Uncharacterized protein n=1 Tax=Tuber borchii TaxID=42251 RepID=A0A2T6ZG44_TUBBO|nr:hypothetical protein B9Z19DRAFT_444650 [Tuber borchii]
MSIEDCVRGRFQKQYAGRQDGNVHRRYSLTSTGVGTHRLGSMAKSTKNRCAGQGTSIGIVGPSNGRHACGAARLKEERQTLRRRGGKERKRTQRRRARLTAIPAEAEAENKTRFSSPSLSLSLYPSLFAGRQKVESGRVCTVCPIRVRRTLEEVIYSPYHTARLQVHYCKSPALDSHIPSSSHRIQGRPLHQHLYSSSTHRFDYFYKSTGKINSTAANIDSIYAPGPPSSKSFERENTRAYPRGRRKKRPLVCFQNQQFP